MSPVINLSFDLETNKSFLTGRTSILSEFQSVLQKKLVSIHLFEPESKFYRSISWLVGFWDSALSLNEPRRSRPPLCPPEPRDILRQCCFSAASCHPTLNYIVSPVTMNRMREAVYGRLNKWFRTMWKQPNPWDKAYGALQVKRHLGWKTETFVVEGKTKGLQTSTGCLVTYNNFKRSVFLMTCSFN